MKVAVIRRFDHSVQCIVPLDLFDPEFFPAEDYYFEEVG